MKQSYLQQLMLYKYRYALGFAVLVLSPVIVLFYRLGKLTPYVSEEEAASGLASANFSLLDNPIDFFYQLLQSLSLTIFGNIAVATRLPSVLFAIIMLVLAFTLLKYWYRTRIAILGTLLIALSSWFLHFARFGTSAITIATMTMALILVAAWFHHTEKRKELALVALLVTLALSLYTPLMLYVVLIIVLAHYKLIFSSIKKVPLLHIGLGSLAAVIILIPLVISITRDPEIAKTLLAIPNSFPTPIEYISNVSDSFAYIFWRSEPYPAIHLAMLAMLDIFTATMAALGLYHYEKHFDQHRTRILIAGFVIMLLVLSLSFNQLNFIILLPFIYIFAATGIITLLTQWYEIFPKNPIARTIGIIPIAMLLIVVAFYHSNRYFNAWAGAPETKAAFSSEPLQLREDIENLTPASSTLVVYTGSPTRIEFSTSDLNNQVDLVTREQFRNTIIKNYDHVYIANGIKTTKEDTDRLKVSPVFIGSSSYNETTAFMRFDIE